MNKRLTTHEYAACVLKSGLSSADAGRGEEGVAGGKGVPGERAALRGVSPPPRVGAGRGGDRAGASRAVPSRTRIPPPRTQAYLSPPKRGYPPPREVDTRDVEEVVGRLWGATSAFGGRHEIKKAPEEAKAPEQEGKAAPEEEMSSPRLGDGPGPPPRKTQIIHRGGMLVEADPRVPLPQAQYGNNITQNDTGPKDFIVSFSPPHRTVYGKKSPARIRR